ncbi:MAG: hypothetical protein FWH22_01670 [Fibromonadales bacterium]|nr:hypothetical protein [Fibromonadales bacterium]
MRNEHEIPLEFEVYGRIIKDGDGNDVHVFRKEDELRGLRRDSSFYWDGSWEVFEFDDVKMETKFRASSGISSLRKYDDKRRLMERYMVDENGDTLTSEKYEWKNGRPIRMTANGIARKYIYGKTLQDTVKVEPSDEGFNYHSGYNGTVGKMPEEGTPEYEIFAIEPYGHVAFGNEGEEDGVYESLNGYFAAKNRVSENSGQLNTLAKVTTSGCVDEEADMPRAQCIKYERKDIPDNAPKNGIYGHADAQLSINFNCECNANGKYQPSFKAKTTNEKIEVYQSVWKYNFHERDWHEFCWGPADLQVTYKHETQHIKNARYVANHIEKKLDISIENDFFFIYSMNAPKCDGKYDEIIYQRYYSCKDYHETKKSINKTY